MKTFVRFVASFTCLSLAAAGCRDPIDTDRTSVDNGTFGETVVTLVCKRIAYLEDLADGGTTDVRGDLYRDACRLGLAPDDEAPASLKALLAKPDALIMHPGPMNRGVEIDSEVADDINRSVIREQVEMGVAVRMACLDALTRNLTGNQ